MTSSLRCGAPPARTGALALTVDPGVLARPGVSCVWGVDCVPIETQEGDVSHLRFFERGAPVADGTYFNLQRTTFGDGRLRPLVGTQNDDPVMLSTSWRDTERDESCQLAVINDTLRCAYLDDKTARIGTYFSDSGHATAGA